jgi:uncharacterized membrane protein
MPCLKKDGSRHQFSASIQLRGTMQDKTQLQSSGKAPRLGWLDALRGIALVTMATYHFTWDLEFFGYAPPGTAYSMPFRIYAHAIASTFLFLAGVSLFLAHGNGIRWPGFWRRFVRVAGAALLVTAATFFAMRDEFIYFGILHEIALASLVGLMFLKVPAPLTALAGALAIAAPYFLRSPIFDVPALYWVGLSESVRRSNDYVPLFPWIGPVLIGIASMKTLIRFDLTGWLTAEKAASNPAFRTLSTAGRHSLAFYLLHQPILFGLVWCCAQVVPPASPDQASSYMLSCKSACVAERSETFCQSFCGCTLDELRGRNLFDALQQGEIDVNGDERVLELSRQCTIKAKERE